MARVAERGPARPAAAATIAASAPPGSWQLTNAVAAWAGEAADYDYATNSCAAGKECGHYTQIVWASTLRAGCAHKLCTANSPFGSGAPNWDFWVCDYEPPGNFIGHRPYGPGVEPNSVADTPTAARARPAMEAGPRPSGNGFRRSGFPVWTLPPSFAEHRLRCERVSPGGTTCGAEEPKRDPGGSRRGSPPPSFS